MLTKAVPFLRGSNRSRTFCLDLSRILLKAALNLACRPFPVVSARRFLALSFASLHCAACVQPGIGEMTVIDKIANPKIIATEGDRGQISHFRVGPFIDLPIQTNGGVPGAHLELVVKLVVVDPSFEELCEVVRAYASSSSCVGTCSHASSIRVAKGHISSLDRRTICE